MYPDDANGGDQVEMEQTLDFLAIVMFQKFGKPEFEIFHSEWDYRQYMGEIIHFCVPHEIVYISNCICAS